MFNEAEQELSPALERQNSIQTRSQWCHQVEKLVVAILPRTYFPLRTHSSTQEEHKKEMAGVQGSSAQLRICPVDSNVRAALPACRHRCPSSFSCAEHLKLNPLPSTKSGV